MAAKKPHTIQVPPEVKATIDDVAARSSRSVAFVVDIILRGSSASSAREGDLVAMEIAPEKDDPRGLVSNIKKAGKKDLAGRVVGGLGETKARLLAWADRMHAAMTKPQAAELDRALDAARALSTDAAQLIELAKSEYPKVRALVAAHPNTPEEVRVKLSKDRDRTVREAAAR